VQRTTPDSCAASLHASACRAPTDGTWEVAYTYDLRNGAIRVVMEQNASWAAGPCRFSLTGTRVR